MKSILKRYVFFFSKLHEHLETDLNDNAFTLFLVPIYLDECPTVTENNIACDRRLLGGSTKK